MIVHFYHELLVYLGQHTQSLRARDVVTEMAGIDTGKLEGDFLEHEQAQAEWKLGNQHQLIPPWDYLMDFIFGTCTDPIPFWIRMGFWAFETKSTNENGGHCIVFWTAWICPKAPKTVFPNIHTLIQNDLKTKGASSLIGLVLPIPCFFLVRGGTENSPMAALFPFSP